mmetsp:Transcript_11572/g.15656  ORF Transcript_11572/g.15656 Transcript_11572/m.15656 type:complete len:150 (-) Transcript_11572:719-1168(-)
MYSNSQERLGGGSHRGSPILKKAFKAKNVDEQVVPASLMSQPIDFNTVNEENYQGGAIGGSVAPDAGEGLRYVDIVSTLKSKADAMLPFFGEDCTVRVFHRRWQFREEGVKTFIEKLPAVFGQGNEESTLVSVNAAVLSTLVEIFKDKV